MKSRKVYDYLERSFAPDALNWVKQAKWEKREVPLSRIELDKNLTNKQDIKKFQVKAEKGKKIHPVILMADRGGKFAIADGRHRSLGQQEAGKRTVQAWVAHPDPSTKLPDRWVTDIEKRHGKGRMAGYQKPEY